MATGDGQRLNAGVLALVLPGLLACAPGSLNQGAGEDHLTGGQGKPW
jgi:hypothetical protein